MKGVGIKIAFEQFFNVDVSKIFSCEFWVLKKDDQNNVWICCKSGQKSLVKNTGIEILFISYFHLDVSHKDFKVSYIKI